MMEHIRQTKVLKMVNFPRIPQAHLSKKYASLYSVILLYYDRVHEIDKINTNQLKSPFRGNGQLEPNQGQNFDTLCFMICSTVRIFFNTLYHNEAGQVDSSINQFSQNIFFSGKNRIRTQFGPKLFNLISHDLSQRFFLKHFSRMRHNRQTMVTLLSFPRNSVLVQLGSLSPV